MSINPEKLSKTERRDILKELEDDHDAMRGYQYEIRRRWVKTEAAVAGRQLFRGGAFASDALGEGWEYAQSNSATEDVDDEHVIFNDLRRVFNTDMQRLTSYFLRPDVVPENKKAEMKEGARIGRIWLSDQLRKTGAEQFRASIARSMILRNVGIVKVSWDPMAGRIIRKPKWELGAFRLGQKMEPEGDVVWRVVNPKCILLPRFTKRIEDADCVEEYHIETVDKVFRDYGVVVKAESISSDYFDWLDYALKEKTSEGGSPSEKVQNCVILKEKLVLPCPRYPRGATFTWVKDTLIRSDIMRYRQMPYFSCQLAFNDELAFCDSILWDLLPIQGYLNQGLSATSRWMKMISQLCRWIHEDTGVKPDELSNQTGVNRTYRGDKKPEWEEVPAVPESIFKLIDLARDFIASHGYSNELAKVRRALSGNALGILQEMDDTIFRPALEQVQSMLSRMSSFSLMIAADRIKNERLIKMSGRQGWQIIEGFKGEMLKGNFHAEVSLMTGMPSNKVLRLEYLKALYKDGLLPKEDVQAFLEFPSDTQPLEDIQKQHEIAEARVQALLKFPENYFEDEDEQGEKLFVCKVQYHVFDNHGLLMAKLQECMQEGFDHWSPWVQMAFLEHWKYHKEQFDLEMQKQAMAAQGPQFPGEPNKPGEGLTGLLSDAMKPAADSFQSGDQQPSRETIPSPMATGFKGA